MFLSQGLYSFFGWGVTNVFYQKYKVSQLKVTSEILKKNDSLQKSYFMHII